ncbi:MAG: NAD(P)H:quinone oxidoreductase [Alphaproteobacteria bacterium]
MTRVLVLYYSSYGHVATMARRVGDGARDAGAEVALRRVPELVPAEVAAKADYVTEADIPICRIDELPDYDAILFGTPTRFGNMASQMKNFFDQMGGLWFTDKLVGKVGGVFTSTGSQHGGQESTILSTHVVLMHLGMVAVGLPYSFKGQMRMDEITGGSPYGASTLADDGQGGDRRPSDNELDGAFFQGYHTAQIAAALRTGFAHLPDAGKAQ